MAAVDTESSHTMGNAIDESSFMGAATTFAIISGCPMPIRFGTSSPTTIDRYVTTETMTIFAKLWDMLAGNPNVIR